MHSHTFYQQGRYVPILLASKSQQDQHLLQGLQMHRLDYTARDQPLNKKKNKDFHESSSKELQGASGNNFKNCVKNSYLEVNGANGD